jgi:CheY-like chemotaxis protein
MNLSATSRCWKPVIAVVDDDPLMIKLMTMLLTLEGYKVIPWSDAATACEMIRERQPNMVTLDLFMQGDWNAGLKVLECLHTDPATSEIPVIIVSATADTLRDDDKRLSELAYARLVKPIGADELFQIVAAALQSRLAAPREGS